MQSNVRASLLAKGTPGSIRKARLPPVIRIFLSGVNGTDKSVTVAVADDVDKTGSADAID